MAATGYVEIKDGDQVQWMWGDASIFGHALAKKNPLRWSSAKGLPETIAELSAIAAKEKYDANRPVLLRVTRGGTLLIEKNYKTIAQFQAKFAPPVAKPLPETPKSAPAPASSENKTTESAPSPLQKKAPSMGDVNASSTAENKGYSVVEAEQPVARVPPKGKALLVLEDGSEHEISILKPKAGDDTFLDIRDLHAKTGCFTFDPGFTCTAACMSAITFIDGPKGVCLYRGYPVQELCERSHALETAYLLLWGNLPTTSQLDEFTKEIKQHMLIHGRIKGMFNSFPLSAHPMAIMVAVIGGLSTIFEELDSMDEAHRHLACVRMIAKIPVLAAMAYKVSIGQCIMYPRDDLSFAENWLYMMFGTQMSEYKVNKVHAKAIDAFMILHMDHEQNASTSTVRTAGSSQANPYACMAAGVASLWGPAHGGANEAVIQMLEGIGTVDNVEQFVEDVKAKKEGVRLMGFGHRVYKNYDPRAKVMKDLVDQSLAELDIKDPLLAVAQALEEKALSDEYFLKRKLYPNVDYYSGILLRAIGIPTSMFTVMFAMSRTVGWMTQWNEMVTEGHMRIARPRQLYAGENQRTYEKKVDASPVRQTVRCHSFELPDCVTR